MLGRGLRQDSAKSPLLLACQCSGRVRQGCRVRLPQHSAGYAAKNAQDMLGWGRCDAAAGGLWQRGIVQLPEQHCIRRRVAVELLELELAGPTKPWLLRQGSSFAETGHGGGPSG